MLLNIIYHFTEYYNIFKRYLFTYVEKLILYIDILNFI